MAKNVTSAVIFAALGTVLVVPVMSYFFGDGFRLTVDDAKYFAAFLAVIFVNRWLDRRAKRKQAEASK